MRRQTDAAAIEAEHVSSSLSLEQTLDLAVNTLATVLAQDLKPSELELAIVGGPDAAKYAVGGEEVGWRGTVGFEYAAEGGAEPEEV